MKKSTKMDTLKMDTSTNAGLPHYSVDDEAYEGEAIFTVGEVETLDPETRKLIDSVCDGVEVASDEEIMAAGLPLTATFDGRTFNGALTI
tara:strand:+ start:2787 stop:3056 length:270 start_codon:yes stop_codon:yes gene_type:complete